VSAAAVFAALLSASASAQSRERVVFVSAIDKATRQPAESLAPADVLVREDGVAREVLRVAPATEPMQIALIVDNSAAMDRHVTNFRDGLKAFVQALGEGHEISLVTYADRPTLVASFAKDRAQVLAAIDRLFPQPNSGGYLLDALQETARGFVKRESPRPVIVVVGTEEVEFSTLTDEVVIEALVSAGAQFHAVMVTDTSPDRTQEERYRSMVLARGTDRTGGRRENLLSSMALPDTLRALAAELNHQFRVVYARPESLIPPR
jgi:hypothetical protein